MDSQNAPLGQKNGLPESGQRPNRKPESRTLGKKVGAAARSRFTLHKSQTAVTLRRGDAVQDQRLQPAPVWRPMRQHQFVHYGPLWLMAISLAMWTLPWGSEPWGSERLKRKRRVRARPSPAIRLVLIVGGNAHNSLAFSGLRSDGSSCAKQDAAAVAAQGVPVAPEKASSKRGASRKKGAPKGQKAATEAKPKAKSAAKTRRRPTPRRMQRLPRRRSLLRTRTCGRPSFISRLVDLFP